MHRLTQTLVALVLVGLCCHRASGQGVADAFFPTGISGGGRLMSASIHPEDSAQAFIVCDMMDVDRTTNEGLTWRLIPTDRLAANADQFLLWIGDTTPGGSGYTSYWYFNHPSGPYYARVGDATLANVNNALLFPFQRAFFTDVDTPKPNRLIQCPWTP